MADEYALSMLKVSLAQICQNVGFQGATNVSLSVLLDIYRRYMESMCRTLHQSCDHFGRTEPVLEDLEMMFGELRISLRELSDYTSQVAPVPFKRKVPLFPVKRPHKLRIPAPDADELQSRPDHIAPHLPLMKPERGPSSAEIQNGGIVDGDQDRKSTNDLSPSVGKLNAARLSVHRATISSIGKQDPCQSGDLIADFSDFDAVKAGLIRIVRIPTPPPTPPPRPVSPLSLPYPGAVSPSTSAISPTTVQSHALNKVAEEKFSKKRQRTILDVWSPKASQTSALLPHPKLKINLSSMSAYKRKKLNLPPSLQKKEKQRLKILPPLEPAGTSTIPALPKRRGRPPGPKKLAMVAAAAAAAAAAATSSESISIPTVPQVEKTVLDLQSSTENTVVADILASVSTLDSSTATTSSVEDLVTSVIEETRSTIKAKEKASEHFADSVLSVISAQNDTSPDQSQHAQKIEEPNLLLAGAGNLSLLLPRNQPLVELPRLDLDQLDLVPSTSTETTMVAPVSNQPSKAEKLKTILQRSRLFVNKEVIKQRLQEKKARKEEEEKKIREVVETTYPPIAKRQDEITVMSPSAVVPPPSMPEPLTAPSPVPIPTPVSTSVAPTPPPAAAPSVTPESAKPSRRPPGIPPTSLRPTSAKSEKPLIRRSSKSDLTKKRELFPPLFQPEHITKTVKPPATDNRKVAPLVISTKSKPAVDQISTIASAKKESTKLIIKLPHHPPSMKSVVEEISAVRKRKHHHHGKEKQKEKMMRDVMPLLTVKKEKAPETDVGSKTAAISDNVAGQPSVAASSPKVLKLKINMKSKIVTPTSSVSEKDSKSKEKKSKVESSAAKTISPQRLPAVAGVEYEDITRSTMLTPPPKSPSAHSKSPSHTGSAVAGGGGGGSDSPPPRTPSPGSSVPPSPIYVNTHSSEEKAIKEEIASPPAKKQKTEHLPETSKQPPTLPRNVIKIDKSQFTKASVIRQPSQDQGGSDNAWMCPVCRVPYEEGAEMIACDECDRWFHWTCVGLTQAPPENENWYCRDCRLRKASAKPRHPSSGSVSGGTKRKHQKSAVPKKKN